MLSFAPQIVKTCRLQNNINLGMQWPSNDMQEHPRWGIIQNSYVQCVEGTECEDIEVLRLYQAHEAKPRSGSEQGASILGCLVHE